MKLELTRDDVETVKAAVAARRNGIDVTALLAAVSRMQASAAGGPTLDELSDVHGSDKKANGNTWFYERLFSPFRDKAMAVIEIGIGGHNEHGKGGESLLIWRDYFKNAQVYGIDINDKSFMDAGRVKTFCGSQVDLPFLDSVVEETGAPYLVVDDGSHFVEHQLVSFKHLFPKLAPGGIYVVEDVQSSYLRPYGGDPTLSSDDTAVAYFRRHLDQVNSRMISDDVLDKGIMENDIGWCLFAHGFIVIGKADGKKESTEEDRLILSMANLSWEEFAEKFHKRKRGDHDYAQSAE